MTRGRAVSIRNGADADAGMTLVEIVVAIGVLSVLLIMVTGLVIQGTRAVYAASDDASIQQEQQNGILNIARLFRYADNPAETSPLPSAFDAASAASATFYTFSGSTGIDRVPYRVTVRTCPTGATTCHPGDVIAEIQPPVLANGVLANAVAPTFGTAAVRPLVIARPGRTPTLTLTYLDSAGDDMLSGNPGGSIASDKFSDIASVRVRITDSDTRQFADQTVTLVNPR